MIPSIADTARRDVTDRNPGHPIGGQPGFCWKVRPSPGRILPRRLEYVKKVGRFSVSIEGFLVIAGLVALYLGYGWFHPYTACGRCEGGKHWDIARENWRDCRKCEGSGKKIRLLRRILGGVDGL